MTRRLPLLALPLLLAACATPPQSQPPQTLYHYQLGEGTDDRPLSLAQAVDRVKDADIVLVGEFHSHPAVHLLQANLLAQLASMSRLDGRALVLSMEQFSRADQPVLDAYLAGRIGDKLVNHYSFYAAFTSDEEFRIVAGGKAVAHRFAESCVRSDFEKKAYWRDVGTIDAYHEAHMDLVSVEPEFNLYNRRWPIWTSQV